MRNKFACVSDPNEFVSCAGDKFDLIYDPVIGPDGSIELKVSGKVDLQDMINSFRDSTDIQIIIRRLQAGDSSMMREPLYGDFTSMPKTYADALQLVMDREKQFYQLPLDIRNQFDNDFRKWFATSGSDEWLSKMDPVIKKDVPSELVKEVIDNES